LSEEKLSQEFNSVVGLFTPVPPPLKLNVEKVPTFAVDLSKMQVKAPEYWSEIEHLKELLGHEVKHASGDGLPYTYRDALRHEALLMKNLGVPLAAARSLLNVVYDAIVDLRVAAEGLDAKGMCDEWLKLFPVKEEGTSYHLLQVLYKDFFEASLPDSEYERGLRAQVDYWKLKDLVKLMAQNKLAANELDGAVLEAARLVFELSRVELQAPPMDVGFDRGDPGVRADAAEVGLELGLNSQQLAELMGVGEEELEKALEEAAEDKVRTALWRKILGFRELFTASALLDVREPVRRRWKPYSRRVDPVSVAKAPDDPRRWMEPSLETVMTVEQEGEAGGFTKLVALIDCSGSTGELYDGRTVLSYIKDAAYGLLAYAKQFSLPVASIAFSSNAWLLLKESRNYVEHGKRVFALRPLESTNLADAVRLALTLKPERALVVLLTDGRVEEGDLELFAEQSEANRVVAAVVGRGVERVKRIGDRVQLYEVKPDKAGRTLIYELHFSPNLSTP
jgi:hypothetical protein